MWCTFISLQISATLKQKKDYESYLWRELFFPPNGSSRRRGDVISGYSQPEPQVEKKLSLIPMAGTVPPVDINYGHGWLSLNNHFIFLTIMSWLADVLRPDGDSYTPPRVRVQPPMSFACHPWLNSPPFLVHYCCISHSFITVAGRLVKGVHFLIKNVLQTFFSQFCRSEYLSETRSGKLQKPSTVLFWRL